MLPFSLLYGLAVVVRNWFYDAGIFKSHSFDIPVISVGNLEVGGAGKSPMTEYLIRLLKSDYKLATLSRGYGRKTEGYLEAGVGLISKNQESRTRGQKSEVDGSPLRLTPDSHRDHNPQPTAHHSPLATQIGDEPAQFKYKFPDITVAVCEDRVKGIRTLSPNHDLILLDDAYQHRAVEPGLSILLFDYNRLNETRFLLPAGNLREPFSGRWRAQAIIVTKCPLSLKPDAQAELAKKVKPLSYQQLFFTSIAYQQLQDLNGAKVNFIIDKDTTVFLLTGIANPQPLKKHLDNLAAHVVHHNYPDHHPFTLKNITKLADEFLTCSSAKKIIITTEKDAQRLEQSWFNKGLATDDNPPVFVIPIQVEFLNESGQQFNRLIFDYVREHTAFGGLH